MPPIAGQLLGGPYDGDTGNLATRASDIPESLWVWACREEHCMVDGIHWTNAEPGHEPDPEWHDPARYDHDDVGSPDAKGRHLYVYADLVKRTDGLSVADETPALATA